MKILFAVLGVGNGHLSRARDVLTHLRGRGEIDIMVSGTDAQVVLPQAVRYQCRGIIFHLGHRGGIDFWKTLKDFHIPKLLRDIRAFPIQQYDLVINDHEPITAYAARRAGVPSISLSHQSSFMSPNVPRPTHRDPLSELVLKYYAPCPRRIGFHFQRYDDFIRTPVVRQEVRELKVTNRGHITVYLRAYDDALLISCFQKIPDVQWVVFSREADQEYRTENVRVRPISDASYLESLASCDGLLTGGGFEAPAEALFLGKKLMVVPQKAQYEQQCNAEAVRRMGVPMIYSVDRTTLPRIADWVCHSRPIQVDYPNHTREIVDEVLDTYKDPRGVLTGWGVQP